MDPKHPGWHATDTIDLLYVVSGECILKLDSARQRRLRPAGSRHAWGNPGKVSCALLVVSIGVKRKS